MLTSEFRLDPLEFLPEFAPEAVVCIDDIERISPECDIQSILGVVNFLSEQKHLDVVLVCNESDLLNGSQDRADAYGRYKEKVLYEEIALQADVAALFERVAVSTVGPTASAELLNWKTVIIEVFVRSNTQNIRDLGRVLDALHRLRLAGVTLDERAVRFVTGVQLDLSVRVDRSEGFYSFDEMAVRFRSMSGASQEQRSVHDERDAFLERYFGESPYVFHSVAFRLLRFGFVDQDAITALLQPRSSPSSFEAALDGLDAGRWHWLGDSELQARLTRLTHALSTDASCTARELLTGLALVRDIVRHTSIPVEESLTASVRGLLAKRAAVGDNTLGRMGLSALPEVAQLVASEQSFFEAELIRNARESFAMRLELAAEQDLVDLATTLGDVRTELQLAYLQESTSDRLFAHRKKSPEGFFRFTSSVVRGLPRVEGLWPGAIQRLEELRSRLDAICRDPSESRMDVWRAGLLSSQIPPALRPSGDPEPSH